MACPGAGRRRPVACDAPGTVHYAGLPYARLPRRRVGPQLIMYACLSKSRQRDTRKLLNALAFGSVVWPIVLLAAFALLLGGLGASVGLPPVEFGLDFIDRAAPSLSGVVAKLWLICFFGAAFCYGIGPRLTGFLQHRSLAPPPMARFTRSVAMSLPAALGGSVAAFLAGPHGLTPALTRPSRIALSTASDLAGSAPRLE